MGQGLDLYTTIFEVIDLRSFSNLWFWIMLAVVWSTTSHWVLGVPHDMAIRAAREGGQAEADFEIMVRINISRMQNVIDRAGVYLVGMMSFFLAFLATAGFHYGIEFCQALFLIIFPLSIVGFLTLRTARRVAGLSGEALRKRLSKHRFWTQVIGICAIFVTSVWGMGVNMSANVLGY